MPRRCCAWTAGPLPWVLAGVGPWGGAGAEPSGPTGGVITDAFALRRRSAAARPARNDRDRDGGRFR